MEELSQPVHAKQLQGKMFLHFAAITLVTNAFMVVAPSKVMPQTCEAAYNSSLNMSILLFIALVGVTAGCLALMFAGLLAPQRSRELKRLNENCAKSINAAIRRQPMLPI